jgi:alkylhydroperoxidase family enzyme
MHAHFSDAEIVDATFSIGSWMALGRLTHVLELDGVCMPTMAP